MNSVTEKKNLYKTFFRYVIPSIGAMLVTSLYVVVDGVFVGRGLGSDALAAINIAGPYIMTIVALTMMITVGGATLAAISIGQGDRKQADNYFSISLISVILFSLVTALITALFPESIVHFLGANDVLIQDAACYLKYFVLFSVFFCSASTLAAFVRNDGAPRLAFWGMVAGGVSNIFLDWLFIFPLNMGIKGSAIASGLGQTLSCAILISHFIGKKEKLHLQYPKVPFRNFAEICKRGTPEFMNQLFQPITVLCYNLIAVRVFGEIGVAAFSTVYYILTITVSVFVGLTQGTQPLISLSFGEGNAENEKFYYHMGTVFNVFLSVLIYIVMFFFGEPIIRMFNNDPNLIQIGCNCMNIYGISFLFTAVNTCVISYYTAKKQTKEALLLSAVRCLLFIPLFVFAAPAVFGHSGVWVGISVAEVFTIMLAILIGWINRKKQHK